MTNYELSFTSTFYNESHNLPKYVNKLVSHKLNVLKEDPYSAHGDAKKLKGYSNVYRARIGDYRLFYLIGGGWVKLLSVRKRDERTYEDELPDVVAPAVAPDAAMLEPQQQGSGFGGQGSGFGGQGSGFGGQGSGFGGQGSPEPYPLPPEPSSPLSPEPYPLSPEPSAPLPYPLTETLLAQWRIPAEYRAAALAATTEDDLLELTIPERYLTRILDNLFPRELALIVAQPEYLLPTPEAVEYFTEEDLGNFLLKLTPEQQELVAQDRRGPTLVKGGPGTGKSTLAIYRVQRLLERGVGSILFTTYTNALVGYSEQLLSYLLGKPPADCGVKVSTVDALATHFYARGWGWPNFATEGQALELLREALAQAEMPGANVFDQQVRRQSLERLGADYLLQEFLHVIEAWALDSLEAYLALERRGRRTPLKPNLREALWAVYSHWRALMRAQGLVLNEQIRRGALEVALGLETAPYQALVIDEAQDLSPVALRFLLALVASPDYVYLTADAAQSLYQRGFSWKQVHADLNVTGRTLLLKRNYRNTAQIMAACAAILSDSAAGDEESLLQEPSAHHGEAPQIMLVADSAEEAAAIHAFFSAAARRYRLPVHSGAVLCTSQKIGRALAQKLSALGMPAIFQAGKQIDITAQQVKVLTLHSAKGLEFPFVAVVGLDAGRLPRQHQGLPPEEEEALHDEQRRLFYVGCSRAMRALLVCGAVEAPSPFLASLQEPLWSRG
ncbi:MAG: DNA helicase UvrD [Candidatus Viridilinea halotolerans]|uniref:DNA 3'-5' helicase n=1 Tax=Candidatus Viridilinea halotolerans TaxID=2491704 RepID=A0A426TQV5_9CHLR|nr:MAG: DNA helicase UvrD [Candidatus Viridilinea halotolerans]